MSTHDDARDWLSAQRDGELPAPLAVPLAEHLSTCAECAAYAEQLTGLGALLERLDLPTLDAGPVTERVLARVSAEQSPVADRRTRRRLRVRHVAWVPAVVGLAASLVVLVGGGPARFALPDAAAAAPLAALRSVVVERELIDVDGAVTVERTWYRAPSSLRVETTSPDGAQTLRIVVPGQEYVRDARGARLTTGLAPTVVLPEPLSPTVALLGELRGDGPVIAGRRTTRYVLNLDGEVRVADVDSGRAGTLGAATADAVLGKELLSGAPPAVVLGKGAPTPPAVVLGKGAPTPPAVVLGKGAPTPPKATAGVARKQVRRIDYDVAIADDRFAIPRDGPGLVVRDAGHRATALAELDALQPDALPQGFALSAVTRGPDGASALLTRGALPVLLSTRPATEPGLAFVRQVRVTTGGGVAVASIRLPLYGLPAVTITRVGGGQVTVAAALPLPSLLALVESLYGVRAELVDQTP